MVRKWCKDSLAFLARLTIISLIFPFIEQIARASEYNKAAFGEVLELDISVEYPLNDFDINYEDHIKCNHLHCSDDLDIQNNVNITVCPELQNATFTDGQPFDGLGRPQCDVHLELSIYPNKVDVHNGWITNDIPKCEINAKNFPNNKSTLECIKKLTQDDSITKVVWIIHGYYSDSTAQWLHDMKNNIQLHDNRHGKVAVILVDWGDFWFNIIDWVGPYIESAQDTQYVGYGLAIIADAIKKGFKRKIYFHCIGHSLGAHICGFAGKQLKRLSHDKIKFDRITGLDPAGPIFCEPFHDAFSPHHDFGPPEGSQNCIDSKYRLSDKDADIVDIIHTDGQQYMDGQLQFGTMKPLGTVDFYAGKTPLFGFEQPGCEGGDMFYGGCSHTKSYQYFTRSVINETLFPLISNCQNGYPRPSKCKIIENKKYPEFDLIHRSSQPLPGMGYWVDENAKGIYTIDVTGYCIAIGDAQGCGNTTFVY